MDRSKSQLGIHSLHASGYAVGMGPLSAQIQSLPAAVGTPVAAINGDFYQMERAFAGHPRGLQIIEGEPISAPSGGVVFWVDAFGHPQATNVFSQFHITWPDQTTTKFDLNGERAPDNLVLYTSMVGPSTHTKGGGELILEKVKGNPWLPLRMGKTYTARVREVRTSGDTLLASDIAVLSIGPALKNLPTLSIGSTLRLSMESSPNLGGAKTAIGCGSVLVHEGKRQKIRSADDGSYEATTMSERHPRSAIGWNAKSFFMIVVDGRQKKLSIGMTLDELAAEMLKLGCEEAVSFDGGGSTTLWCEGAVRNSPCDGHERPIANSLVIVRKGK